MPCAEYRISDIIGRLCWGASRLQDLHDPVCDIEPVPALARGLPQDPLRFQVAQDLHRRGCISASDERKSTLDCSPEVIITTIAHLSADMSPKTKLAVLAAIVVIAIAVVIAPTPGPPMRTVPIKGTFSQIPSRKATGTIPPHPKPKNHMPRQSRR